MLAASLAFAAPTTALIVWQIAHGPFVTASDVRNHNAHGADIAEIEAALAAPELDFPGALTLYAFGKQPRCRRSDRPDLALRIQTSAIPPPQREGAVTLDAGVFHPSEFGESGAVVVAMTEGPAAMTAARSGDSTEARPS